MSVHGELRVAALAVVPEWAREETLPLGSLDALTLNHLAREWREDGLMEHASIASFARFTLAMLSLGAPPEIIAEAQRAAGDEVLHARLCFGVATTLDGAQWGPGALDVKGALDDISAEKVLRDLVIEGCVGETIAAMVARAQRQLAEVDTVTRALETIADDEARHSALAWKAAAWVLKARPELVTVAERAFSDALAGVTVRDGVPEGVSACLWRHWGRLDTVELTTVTREAVDSVILPCARALIESAKERGRGVSGRAGREGSQGRVRAS